MRKQAEDDFLIELSEEEPDAAHFAELGRPDEANWPEWSGTVREAWHSLRDDRFYGAMGGMSGIYYSSVSAYAHDHGIPIRPFVDFVMALDGEFVSFSNEKALVAQEPTEDTLDG